jgi:hypothetical protein
MLAAPYRELSTKGPTADGNAYRYSGANYWIPGLELVHRRVKFAEAEGLQHIIIWELGQDLPPSNEKSMLRAANAARRH